MKIVTIIMVMFIALGYLGHVSGDGFAHAWVNQQVNGYWDYFDGSGMFGPRRDRCRIMKPIRWIWIATVRCGEG